MKIKDKDYYIYYDRNQLIDLCNKLFTANERYKNKNKYKNTIKALKKELNTIKKNLKIEECIYKLFEKNKNKYATLSEIPKISKLEKDIKHLQNYISKLEKKLKEKPLPSINCERKKRYNSTIEAEMALSTIRKKGDIRRKTPVRYYKCSICSGYHLTSNKKNKPNT